MKKRHRGRAVFGGTFVIGIVVLVAGAAFACTKFYGEITGSGNHTNNSDTSVNGNAAAGMFQWCEDPEPFQVNGTPTSDANRGADWGTKVTASSPSLTVSVAPSGVCQQNGSNKLPQGTYKVGISEGYWDESEEGFATTDEDNCHTLENGGSGQSGNGTIIDTDFAVDSFGVGEETFSGSTLDNNLRDAVSGAGGWNTVCVYFPQGQSLDPSYWNPANALNFRSL